MRKEFIDLFGEKFTEVFNAHDINKYDVLYHVTTKDRLNDIKENGLIIGKPIHKSLNSTNLLFFSYPINHTTEDLFRCYDDSVIISIDTEKLIEDNIIFYDDVFSKEDLSSNRNHICTDVNISAKYIKKITEL